MRVGYQKLSSKTSENSFGDFWVKVKSFGVHWHYHPEVEICYIKQGEGHRIIGDSIEPFTRDDLVLVGSNLPHTWVSSEIFNKSSKHMEVYVIQFHAKDILNQSIEFKGLFDLLDRSKRGLSFDLTKEKKFKSLLLKVDKRTGLEKYLALINLLNLMATSEARKELVSKVYVPDYSKKAEGRIEKVCNYLHDNYRERITIEEVSDLVSMNQASFCRFFKKYIGKTVIEYINDLRINYACYQLQNSSIPIYKIAFDSGYQSITQFNKVFKRMVNDTPKNYRSLNQTGFVDFIK
ncbi:AraC family transcriptional regulator [Seonamhaeicola sp.]|uniref:AraC family transcriptional regulator n=1 Tax=Seonamhaeicola sp. TaxID=1912245 RepID=UPI002617479B|nr:AraC family transcriptional regulator [Seonamhaeicola sp.]